MSKTRRGRQPEDPRETIIANALKVVAQAFVTSERGVRIPAKWDTRVTEEVISRKKCTIVTLRPKNGIMSGVRIRPKRYSVSVDCERSFVEVKTRGSIVVRIRMKH
jgi:hypothetical protein